MPELPEVETIARGVQARVQGDVIVEAWFGSHREPFKTPAARQAKGLEGRTILAVHRTGKHIVCELGERGAAEPTAQWIVHLGMTGRLLVTTPDAPLATHTHARLRLKSGREVRFVDPRRFGRLEFRDLVKTAGFAGPGAEPLTVEAEEFAGLFRGRKLAIKAALLNQSLLAGVGNIYASEALFGAGIHPQRSAGRISAPRWDRLADSIRRTLESAIEAGGSTLRDFVSAEGRPGYFQHRHAVYDRAGKPCPRCRGRRSSRRDRR